jgi:hypothetical protein
MAQHRPMIRLILVALDVKHSTNNNVKPLVMNKTTTLQHLQDSMSVDHHQLPTLRHQRIEKTMVYLRKPIRQKTCLEERFSNA